MTYIFCILLIFYFVPAISVYVRLFNYGSAPYLCDLMLLLPYTGYYIAFRVLKGVLKRLTEEKVIKNKSLISNYFIAYQIWKTYVPMMFVSVALIIINNTNEIKNVYKRECNNYREDLITDLEKIYA